ncbi:6-phosphogluconolactonase [Jatrophihabitans sp. GAS493]|uniref:6-phosphogluconolactonase n=1 Tax=Jatrophihabitans sp. GAS493 TaxID=1907575 RepID=UPI000BC02292|nr:6-phosphogluconolactonase [Jatrophihabitans sp. GAS493]SOD74008.1 6-phosphogluconolactonase [Jatrophihabitans sp. GAS493]
MAADPETVIEASAEALARSTAARTLAALAAAQDARPLAHLVVTGGSILENVLSEMQSSPERDSVDWSRVALWWGDERFVASDSDDRNDKVAFAKFFSHVPLAEPNIHRMPSTDGPWGEDVAAGVAAYAGELAAAASDGEDVPRFDVVLLGVGPDGHCASLFPGAPGVYETEPAVIAVHDSPKPPPTRTSLTFRGLGAANEMWVIVAGAGKADAVKAALGGADRAQIPSAGARGRVHTLWLLDEAAASGLTH